MSNNTISTNISISNNSTDQMMDSLSLKRSETLHISDPEKNTKPGKRINCRLFCCGFVFGLISTILIFAVTLYTFDYMGTIVLDMPYSPWKQQQRSSSFNRTASTSYSHPDGGSLIHDDNSGHSHAHHAHHQQQQFDPISRSYVLPDRFNSTSTISSVINNQVNNNNSLSSTQPKNSESDKRQITMNSGDLLVNSGNDIDVVTNETSRVHPDDNNHHESNDDDDDDSSHVSPPFQPIQFDDSADSVFNNNNQVRRDGKTIDLSQRSTTSAPYLIADNITVNHHHENSSESSTLSSIGTSVEMMIMETSNRKDNISSESIVTLIPPESEITIVTREILNHTDNNRGRNSPLGSVGSRSVNMTNDDDESLPTVSTIITFGFIENSENSSTLQDGSNNSHENQSTIITESPIGGIIIDLTTNGQPEMTDKMTIGISSSNLTTTNEPDDHNKSTSPHSDLKVTLDIDSQSISNNQTKSTPLINVTQSATILTTQATTSISPTIKLTPTTLTTTLKSMTQSNEPLTSSSTMSPSLSESDTQRQFNNLTINITNNQTTVTKANETLLTTKTIKQTTIDEPFNQTKLRIGDLATQDNNNTNESKQSDPLIVTRKLEITLTTTPLTTLITNVNSSENEQFTPTIKSQLIEKSTNDSNYNKTDHLNHLPSSDYNLTIITSMDNLNNSNVNLTQSTIHPVERSIIDNSTINNLNNLTNEMITINGGNSSLDIDNLSITIKIPVIINGTNLNDSNDLMIKSNATSNWEKQSNSTQIVNNLFTNETETINGTSSRLNETITPIELIGNNLNESLSNLTIDSVNGTSDNYNNNTMESMIGTTASPLECNSKQIRCFINQDKEACLSADVVCDGVRDCTDGSDESDCSQSCGSNFRCGNESSVTCISRKYLCDGLMDCDDGSDESSCYFASCENQLSCADKSSCLLPIQVCDGKYDCRDHSDEQECVDHSTCLSVGKFFCDNMCIEYSLRCDGSKDCSDGTDESNCTCTNEEFKCWNGDCIDKTLVCDGQVNCRDSSDEWSCVKTDENNVVSMVNPSTGNWALLCADESPLGESDYSLLCQKMGLESAVNYSTTIIKTIGEVEWVIHNGSNVISLENCNSSSILMLECQTFKCSMMATTPLQPTSSSTQPSSLSSTLSPTLSTPLANISPIPESSLNTTSTNTTTTTTSTTKGTTMVTDSITTSTSSSTTSPSTPLISSSTLSSGTSPSTLSSSNVPIISSTPPTPTGSSPASTIEASLLAIPAINYNIPLSRPTRAASPNEIQSMVIVKRNATDSIKNKKQCLAQIISPMWLLSSAECLKQLQDVQGLIVEANTSRFLGTVNQVILHPHTSKFRYLHIRDFDLALINLKSPLPLSSSLMSSICLPESDVASDITCFMPVLGETEARPYLIQDRSLCNERRHFNSSLNQRQICSSASDESPDYVPDPGSNLVCLSSSTEWFIGGFVSFASPRTSYTKHPSVFSNVFAMKDFINHVIAVNLYQSKIETKFNYTFDLTSSLGNNETLINSNGTSSIDNNDIGKTDNSIGTTVNHDSLKQAIKKYSNNILLHNGTENVTINQSLIDLTKFADRSRSLNLDYDNSSIYIDSQLNTNQTINGSSLILDELPIINNQTNGTQRNTLRSEHGRLIDLVNDNENGTIINQMEKTTNSSNPIDENLSFNPTTDSISNSSINTTSTSTSALTSSTPTTPSTLTISSSSSSTPFSISSSSIQPFSSSSSSSSSSTTSLSSNETNMRSMMIMETSTGPTTLGVTNYPIINNITIMRN